MSKRTYRLHVVLIVALVAMMIVPAFSPVKAAGAKVLVWGSGLKGDIPTIDPALSTDTTSVQVSEELYYPIVRPLETELSNMRPGIADKWETSKDGLTVTFHLRKDISWVKWDGKAVVQVTDANGKPMMVTAHDFEYGMKRTLDPRTASQYAYVYTTLIKGADKFNAYTNPPPKTGTPDPNATLDPAALKKLADAVGYKATDDWTVVATLQQPVSFALNILSLWGAVAQPQAAIEKFGDKWTEPGNAASYGPYVVSEWKHDESLTLTANPFWPDVDNAPKPKIDQVKVLFVDETASFNNYEAGSVDYASVPNSELDRVKADPELSKELNIAPAYCTYYYGFNVTKAPFDNVHMRRAFSYAVDRQSLVDNVTKGGQEPAGWMSRPGLAAAPTRENSPKLGIGYDPDKAKAELKAYMDEKKITDVSKIPQITLVANQGAGHESIAQAIQQMWKTVLGIDVQFTQQEWKVYLKTLNTDPPQVWRLGWCEDYPDANNFTKDVFNSSSGQNSTRWKSAEFDKLTDQAALEQDPAKRLALYQQAEDILCVKEAPIIPLYWYTSVGVTKPYVTRTFALDNQRWEKWDINK